MAKDSIDQLARRLAESLPQSVKALRDDAEQNFRSILHSGLERLDLVTREEFDVQEAVLARTRAKLEDLERRVDEMEGETSATEDAAPKKKKAAKKPAAKKKATQASGEKPDSAQKDDRTAGDT